LHRFAEENETRAINSALCLFLWRRKCLPYNRQKNLKITKKNVGVD
jgi:hypothetical protein